MIKDDSSYFCCQGCQGVFHLLHDEGLDTFYDKRQETLLEPVSIDDKALDKFDLQGFKAKYISVDEQGLCHIHLIIEGIHCGACVWLNEKVLHRLDGVMEASINYSSNKAHIVWDEDSLQLSKMIETIRAIGYDAYPYDPKLQEQKASNTRKTYYLRILVAVFGAMNIMWLAIAHYAGYFYGIQQSFKDILNVAQFLLATPVLFYSGWIFFRGAYYGYKNNIVTMDTLVASGALSAYLYSIYAMITQTGEVYFDSVVMIVTFVLVGKYLEVLSKKHAVDTLDSLMVNTPTEVISIKDKTKTLISLEEVNRDDILELSAGDKVVIDGIITQGGASFDESSLTGENIPSYKKVGDEILSGSICLDSTLHYQATHDVSHSLLSSIVSLLESSLAKKPKIEQLANTLSGYFSSTILVLALATFVGWYLSTDSFETALIVGISVIVIACPCALGLATPMATLVGIGMASKKGILFKEASFLETMAAADILALDKTGTITEGKPSVVSATIEDDFNPSTLYSLVSASKHPISKGIKRYLENTYTSIDTLQLDAIKSIEAKGIEAFYQGDTLQGGNASFIDSKDSTATQDNSNHSLFFFSVNGKVLGKFELSDTIREGAKEAIEKIQNLGIEVCMLTGDHENASQYIASQVGITQIHSQLLPQDKAQYIQQFQRQHHKVIMVGDGINDAIALASSDIAIAMGNGADIAISVSDVVLLDDKPMHIYEAIKLSRRTFRTVKENLAFSLLYNIITIPLAILGFVNPLIASLSMSLSSLVVVGNSLWMRKK
jgi:Cu+-exporting ATPase